MSSNKYVSYRIDANQNKSPSILGLRIEVPITKRSSFGLELLYTFKKFLTCYTP